MKIFKFPAFLCSVLALSGCRDYEPENLSMSLFMHAYGDNFVAQVGQISPEQSWDFSTAGGHRGQANRTRAVTLKDGVWYYPQEQTLTWMKNELQENTDNSDKCQDFFLSWTPGMSFQIVPIYEGKATMDWKLYMKVSSTSGQELFNEEIWSKGENVQIIGPTLWQFTDDEVSIWYETTSPSVKIWLWNDHTTGQEFTGGVWNSQVEDLKDMTKVGMHGEKYVFKWTSPYDKNSTQGIPSKVIFKPQGAAKEEINFRNHGYVYQGTPNYTGHDEGHSANGFNSQISRYDGDWRDFTGEDDAALASDFRAKPIEISEPSSESWPLGSIVSFYLKITDNHGLVGCAENNEIMSTLNHQIVYLNVPSENMPTNVDSGDGVITGILGCEDSSRNGYYFENQGSGETKEHPRREKTWSEENLIYYWGKSDWDYNDVVFLINGVIPEPVVITNDVSVSTVEKRYMAEDLTDTGDMDFNDIVVDVKYVRYTYWNVNESTGERKIDTDLTGPKSVTVNGETLSLDFTNGICDVQTATVRRLCGTVPIRFQVGNTLLPWVTNPSNAEMSKAQLERTFDNANVVYGKGSEITTGNNPDVTLTVEGWNPADNNVVVYVGWDGKKVTEPDVTEPDVNALSSAIKSGSDWWSTFPARGTIPCIIATDVTDPWTPECVNITYEDWWKTNFISTKNE